MFVLVKMTTRCLTLNFKIMNALVNRVQLIGSLGQDPEIKKFDNGKVLAKFSMATNETYRNAQGEKVTETQWHNVIAWGSTAGILEKYVRKGDRIGIEGKLVTRQWEDKEGGKRYTTEVVANDVLLLSQKKAE
jgi:single-strand DNA-binding protein